jgi:hypothetical protein
VNCGSPEQHAQHSLTFNLRSHVNEKLILLGQRLPKYVNSLNFEGTIMRKLIGVVGIVVVAMLTACVSSHVLVGRARPPISPDQVQVYLHPPANYEEIAILDTSSRASWAITAQGKTDKVIQRLKEEAAKLGANGILLQGIGDQAAGSIGSGFGSASASGNSATAFGFGGSAAVFQKTGSGLAIYVAPEQLSSR